MAKTNKYLGPTGLTELINLIQADFQKKQDWMQFPKMPDATLYSGKVVQYTGISDNTYIKGCFYYSNGLKWIYISSNSDVYIALKKYPDSEHYDADAVYPDTAETVNVDGLEVEAFTDQEIEDLYMEV